jgi:hypothetical protein
MLACDPNKPLGLRYWRLKIMKNLMLQSQSPYRYQSAQNQKYFSYILLNIPHREKCLK